jgi:hypothetical protein
MNDFPTGRLTAESARRSGALPITIAAGTDLMRERLCGVARVPAPDQARGGGSGGLSEMPTSRGRSVARGSIVSRGNSLVANGDGGSKAASAGAELVLEVDPFFEAAASAVSSAYAAADLRESALARAASWA